MASAGGAFKTAADFFGADADGVEKFKTVAMRALFDQKLEEELTQTRLERDRLRLENASLVKEVAQLKLSMASNIDDRERVLAFKSKRIEELLIKAKEYEAINTSLLHTINGSSELTEAGRNTRASNALLERGLPLFHAVETCKEHEFKRLWEEKKHQCDQLQQQLAENETLVAEMQAFKRQKEDWATQVVALEKLVVTTTTDKDEKIHFLERKLVFEHERLTREKEAEVLAHQRDMEKQLTLQLDATTQRTIDENVRVNLELRYQNTQVERLLKQVDAIAVENRRVIHDKQLVDEMNALLSKKIKFYEQLFAKMQQHDQRKTEQIQSYDPQSSSSSTRRKPPLPSLALGSTIGMQSAFALCMPSSPSRSPSRGDGPSVAEDSMPLHFDMALVDLLGEQLDSSVTALDAHMQKREFTRKEVKAMVQSHDDALPLRKDSTETMMKRKKRTKPAHAMLSPSEYSSATYASRRAQQFQTAPVSCQLCRSIM
jgi:hypothetical protein